MPGWESNPVFERSKVPNHYFKLMYSLGMYYQRLVADLLTVVLVISILVYPFPRPIIHPQSAALTPDNNVKN